MIRNALRIHEMAIFGNVGRYTGALRARCRRRPRSVCNIGRANLGRWKARPYVVGAPQGWQGWRFNSKPRVTRDSHLTPLIRSVTRLESFRSAWISDWPVAPASLVSERRDRHGVASMTSLLVPLSTLARPRTPPALTSFSHPRRSHVHVQGARDYFLQELLYAVLFWITRFLCFNVFTSRFDQYLN